VDVHNDGLHYWFPVPFSVADKKRICTRPSLLLPFTEISMFPFYGWGGFQIRLARRRAHPCDKQVVAIACSFSLFFHVKVLVSILWVGLAEQGRARAPPEVQAGDAPRGSDQREGMGRSAAAL